MKFGRRTGVSPRGTGPRGIGLSVFAVLVSLVLLSGHGLVVEAQESDRASPMPGATAAVGTHGEALADEAPGEGLADEEGLVNESLADDVPGQALADEAPGVAWPAGVEAEAVAAIAQDLNCPLCQGYNLQDCPLVVCQQMRALIAQKLAAGQGRQAIIDDFVAEYGPQVLNAPPNEGVHRIAWWLPFLVVVAAAAGAVAYARRDGGDAGAAVPGTRTLKTGSDQWVDSGDVSQERREELERLLEERGG